MSVCHEQQLRNEPIFFLAFQFNVLLTAKNTTMFNVGLPFIAYKLPQIEVEVKDEIAAIAEAFNAMATTLEKHARHEKELMEAAKITSGTGKSSPASIMILPAEYKGEVLAVME